jgi:glycosyltransferase involved in cell wall biosynthesis
MLPPVSRQETFAVSSPVTIVLPVHNAERTLRPMVAGILELANSPQQRLTLAIVDDGSTDDTFETACEIARDYPQVRVFRQPFQGGLGPALEDVRQRLGIGEAIVHDGVGPIDLAQLTKLLNEGAAAPAAVADAASAEHRGSRRFAAVSALNTRMASAHRSVMSFHWLKLAEPARPRRKTTVLTHLSTPTFGGDMTVPLS